MNCHERDATKIVDCVFFLLQIILSALIDSDNVLPQVKKSNFLTYIEQVTENYRKVPVHLNPSVRSRSTINFGELSLSTKRKMKEGQCLNIVVFGGSVSCGRYLISIHSAKLKHNFYH